MCFLIVLVNSDHFISVLCGTYRAFYYCKSCHAEATDVRAIKKCRCRPRKLYHSRMNVTYIIMDLRPEFKYMNDAYFILMRKGFKPKKVYASIYAFEIFLCKHTQINKCNFQ